MKSCFVFTAAVLFAAIAAGAEKVVTTFHGIGVLEGAVFELDGEKEYRIEAMVQLADPKFFYAETLMGFVYKIQDDGEEVPCANFNLVVPLRQRVARGSMVLDELPTGRYAVSVAAAGSIAVRVVDTGKPAGTTRANLFRRCRLVGTWEQIGSGENYAKCILTINADGSATQTFFRNESDADGFDMNLSLTPTSAIHAMVYGISEDGLRFPWGQFAIEKNRLISSEIDITDKTKRAVQKTYQRSRDAK